MAEALLVLMMVFGIPAIIAALAVAFVTLGKANQALDEVRLLAQQAKRTRDGAQPEEVATEDIRPIAPAAQSAGEVP